MTTRSMRGQEDPAASLMAWMAQSCWLHTAPHQFLMKELVFYHHAHPILTVRATLLHDPKSDGAESTARPGEGEERPPPHSVSSGTLSSIEGGSRPRRTSAAPNRMKIELIGSKEEPTKPLSFLYSPAEPLPIAHPESETPQLVSEGGASRPISLAFSAGTTPTSSQSMLSDAAAKLEQSKWLPVLPCWADGNIQCTLQYHVSPRDHLASQPDLAEGEPTKTLKLVVSQETHRWVSLVQHDLREDPNHPQVLTLDTQAAGEHKKDILAGALQLALFQDLPSSANKATRAAHHHSASSASAMSEGLDANSPKSEPSSKSIVPTPPTPQKVKKESAVARVWKGLSNSATSFASTNHHHPPPTAESPIPAPSGSPASGAISVASNASSSTRSVEKSEKEKHSAFRKANKEAKKEEATNAPHHKGSVSGTGPFTKESTSKKEREKEKSAQFAQSLAKRIVGTVLEYIPETESFGLLAQFSFATQQALQSHQGPMIQIPMPYAIEVPIMPAETAGPRSAMASPDTNKVAEYERPLTNEGDARLASAASSNAPGPTSPLVDQADVFLACDVAPMSTPTEVQVPAGSRSVPITTLAQSTTTAAGASSTLPPPAVGAATGTKYPIAVPMPARSAQGDKVGALKAQESHVGQFYLSPNPQQTSLKQVVGATVPYDPDDGPLFRATITELEKKTASLKANLKRLLKSITHVIAKQHELNEAEMTLFNDASRALPALSRAVDGYFEPLAKAIVARRDDLIRETETLLLDPLQRLYTNDVKTFEAKKRLFDQETEDFYAYAGRFLGQKKDDPEKAAKRKASDLTAIGQNPLSHAPATASSSPAPHATGGLTTASTSLLPQAASAALGQPLVNKDGVVMPVGWNASSTPFATLGNTDKGEKPKDPESKFAWKRRHFDLTRFDYFSFMTDLHGSKDVQVLHHMLNYAEKQIRYFDKGHRDLCKLAPEAQFWNSEVTESTRETHFFNKEREEQRRAIEIKSTGAGPPKPAGGVASFAPTAGDVYPEGAFDGQLGAGASSRQVSRKSSFVHGRSPSATVSDAEEEIIREIENSASGGAKYTGIRDLDDVAGAVSVGGQRKKEGFLYATRGSMAGNMEKGSIGTSSSWHRFWIVLSLGHVHEYLDWKKSMMHPYRTLSLRYCTVRASRQSERRFCFDIISTSWKRTYQATSNEEMNVWMQVIGNSIESWLNGEDGLQSVSPVRALPAHLPQPQHEVAPPQQHFFSGAELVEMIRAAQEGNDACADCGLPNADWCSINLTVILCKDCAGIHRSLGTHITKVRSLTLDTKFSPELLDLLASIGNRTANAIYEARLPSEGTKPSFQAARSTKKLYIEEKYRNLAYVLPLPTDTEDGPLLTLTDATVLAQHPALVFLLTAIVQSNLKNILWAVANRAPLNWCGKVRLPADVAHILSASSSTSVPSPNVSTLPEEGVSETTAKENSEEDIVATPLLVAVAVACGQWLRGEVSRSMHDIVGEGRSRAPSQSTIAPGEAVLGAATSAVSVPASPTHESLRLSVGFPQAESGSQLPSPSLASPTFYPPFSSSAMHGSAHLAAPPLPFTFIEFLLQNGARLDAVDAPSVVAVAAQHKYWDLVSFLHQRGAPLPPALATTISAHLYPQAAHPSVPRSFSVSGASQPSPTIGRPKGGLPPTSQVQGEHAMISPRHGETDTSHHGHGRHFSLTNVGDMFAFTGDRSSFASSQSSLPPGHYKAGTPGATLFGGATSGEWDREKDLKEMLRGKGSTKEAHHKEQEAHKAKGGKAIEDFVPVAEGSAEHLSGYSASDVAKKTHQRSMSARFRGGKLHRERHPSHGGSFSPANLAINTQADRSAQDGPISPSLYTDADLPSLPHSPMTPEETPD